MPFGVIGGAIGAAIGGVGIAGTIGGVVGTVAGSALASATGGGIAGMLSGGGGGGGGLNGQGQATQGGYYGGSYLPPNMGQASVNMMSDIMNGTQPNNNAYSQFGGQFQGQTDEANNTAARAQAFGNQQQATQQGLTNQQTNLSQNYLNSGRQGQYQAGMDALAPQYQAQGQQGLNMSGRLAGQINPTLGYANQVMQTAFDPQQALYNRTQQQVAQQGDASQASRGLAMSPVGAELSNQSNSNFNIDWQNAQLARQTQGLAAYTGANQSANQLAQGANLSGLQGLTNMNTGAGLGYNASNQIYNGNQTALTSQQAGLNAQNQTQQQYFAQQQAAQQAQQGALVNQSNNFNQGVNLNQQQIANYASYLGLGSPGSQVAQTQMAANGQAQTAQGMGNAMSGLGGAIKSAFGGGQSAYDTGYNGQSNPQNQAGLDNAMNGYQNMPMPYSGNSSYGGASYGGAPLSASAFSDMTGGGAYL